MPSPPQSSRVPLPCLGCLCKQLASAGCGWHGINGLQAPWINSEMWLIEMWAAIKNTVQGTKHKITFLYSMLNWPWKWDTELISRCQTLRTTDKPTISKEQNTMVTIWKACDNQRIKGILPGKGKKEKIWEVSSNTWRPRQRERGNFLASVLFIPFLFFMPFQPTCALHLDFCCHCFALSKLTKLVFHPFSHFRDHMLSWNTLPLGLYNNWEWS